MPKSVSKPARRDHALPTALPQISPNAAGIDVGGASHYVAVPADRDDQPVREFAAFTGDLYRMADWLKACGVETVVILHRVKDGGVLDSGLPGAGGAGA